MINLKNINLDIYNILNTLILLFLLLAKSININADENKILFKINDKAFTSYDYENRIKYLDFVGSNNSLSYKEILNDLISASLFFEYYKKNKINQNYNNEITKIYEKIEQINFENNKTYKYELDKKNIYKNIEIDLIRKNILESILSKTINEIKFSSEDINLLYNYNITYINFNTNDPLNIINKINNLNHSDIDQISLLLNNQKIEFFIKNIVINDINKLDKKIKESINSNKNFILINKNKKISLIFIKKKYETFEGIITKLYSVKSNKKLEKEYLRCENLIKIKDNEAVLNKEYKLIDLNNDLKTNLVSINDYISYNNNEEFIYIVLCELRFDQEKLNNFKFNKLINIKVERIENDFIEKYSKIFNLIIIDE